MKIRRLEIQGFKSFADRTVLRFGDGITGVVGPNGCGKSNIVDAIRWVMGEQSAKHLRGMGMQDVIFAGCEARGPGGMAEVSITFKNDGLLVPPEHAGKEEISVTRRLFRDGTSEYAINGVTCRLRDVLDLFMGTGIGKNAYAIIEQGRIGMIVTSRPEERRALIEDAAGVSRYKARRKQAERRIEATESNLVRVTDIVTELAGRMQGLEEQAEQAERYKTTKEELRTLDLHAAAHELLDLDVKEAFDARNAAELETEVGTRATKVSEAETEIAEAQAALDARRAELREGEEAAHARTREVELAKQNVAFLERESEKHAERIDEAETERMQLREERTKLEAERAELEAAETQLGDGPGEGSRLVQAREVALEAVEEQIVAARAELEADKAQIVGHATSVAERKSALESGTRRAEDLESRALTAEHELQLARERAADAKKRAEKLDRDLTERRQMKLSLEEEQTGREERLAELRGAAEEVEAHLSDSREKLLSKRSRLRSLEQITEKYEGCSDAVRAVMNGQLEGAHGLVADVLTSEPRFETAIEAVLGERLQSIVVAEHADAYRAGEFLRTEQQGRSTFVPLDLRLDHAPWAPQLPRRDHLSSTPPLGRDVEIPVASHIARPAELEASIYGEAPSGEDVPTALPAPLDDTQPPVRADSEFPADMAGGGPTTLPVPAASTSDIPSAGMGSWLEEEEGYWPDLTSPDVCGKMVDLVRAKPGYEQVAHALLGDVVVVESLDKAHELWVNNGHKKTLVTLTGDVLDPMGIFTGGANGGVASGMLAQKREMKELTAEVARLEARVAAAEQKKKDLRGQIEKLEAKVKALSSEGQEGALAIVSLERDLRELRERVERETELGRQKEEEAARLRADLEAQRQELSATAEALSQLEQTRADEEHRVSDAAELLSELEQRARELSDELTSLKVDVAANREKRDGSRQRLKHIAERIQSIETRLERLAEIVEGSHAERVKAAEAIEAAGSRIAELELEATSAAEALEKLRAALEKERTALEKKNVAAKKLRDGIDSLKKKAASALMKVREHQIARENVTARLIERYQVDVPELLREHHRTKPLSPEDLKRTKKLRAELEAIGPINLTAIDELDAVKARHDHLAKQKDDLESAIAALRSAIAKINATSKERYLAAFHLVNEKFQQVFPKVFAGGRCALVMMDESDPLESGIEIMAQPPGKKLQSVNLLSGGEKALTAVSLIFGIFLIKPTPFCLLDEVDAPLDEANVGRYNDMLREMSPISQFILITHNKRTMELPDRLYGVTMEVPGISKIVPVDVVNPGAELRVV